MKKYEMINEQELENVAGGNFRRKTTDDQSIHDLVLHRVPGTIQKNTFSGLVLHGKPAGPVDLKYRRSSQKSVTGSSDGAISM